MHDEKIEVENVNKPGYTERVGRVKYDDMRQALMAILPVKPPGLTVAEAKEALLPHLSDDLFPGGDKAGWWLKAVQLDLEARKIISRGPKSPVRPYRLGSRPHPCSRERVPENNDQMNSELSA